MSSLRIFCLMLLLTFSLNATAEVMVLVQGYTGDKDTWRKSGVTNELSTGGWSDGGHLVNGPDGVVCQGGTSKSSARSFYTISFDSEAPLLEQERQFSPYITDIRANHPGESLYLVGHSAGGVLARLYLVQHPDIPVSALITFASPHLGTESAEVGQQAGQGILGWLVSELGIDDIKHSQGLYDDLAREKNGNLLYWLNRQPHPAIRYVSVVRSKDGFFGMGDTVVPPWSEDMNNVFALRGRAKTLTVDGPHILVPGDGKLLLDILRQLHTS